MLVSSSIRRAYGLTASHLRPYTKLLSVPRIARTLRFQMQQDSLPCCGSSPTTMCSTGLVKTGVSGPRLSAQHALGHPHQKAHLLWFAMHILRIYWLLCIRNELTVDGFASVKKVPPGHGGGTAHGIFGWPAAYFIPLAPSSELEPQPGLPQGCTSHLLAGSNGPTGAKHEVNMAFHLSCRHEIVSTILGTL